MQEMQVSLSSYCAQHSNPFKAKANGRGGSARCVAAFRRNHHYSRSKGASQKWVNIKKNPRLGGVNTAGSGHAFLIKRMGPVPFSWKLRRGGITHAPKGTALNLARGFLESQASGAHYLGIFFRPAAVAYGLRFWWHLYRPRGDCTPLSCRAGAALGELIESLLKITGKSPNVDSHRRLPAANRALICHATHI